MDINFAGQYDKVVLLRSIKLINKPKLGKTILRLVIAILLAALFLQVFTSSNEPSTTGSISWRSYTRLFITIPFLLYFVAQPFFASQIIANKLWKKTSIRQPVSGKMTSIGIDYNFSAEGNTSYSWDQFAKLVIQPDLVLLITANGILNILPKSFFISDADWNRALEIIRNRVKPVIGL